MLKMEYGEIVKYNNKLGELVSDDNNGFLFHPVGYGSYYRKELSLVTQEELIEATLEEKIEYLKREFHWGKIVKVHAMNEGEFIIFEYIREQETEKSFHVYLNFKSTSTSYSSLDSALIGCLTNKYLECNTARYAHSFISKMLEM
jgi:hypothetical protein